MDTDKFERLAIYSGMPFITEGTHRLFTFAPGEGTQKAYDVCLSFLGNGTCFLTLAGEPGRGKTHLALGIGWHWLDNDMGVVKYWHIADLLGAMRREFDHPPVSENGTPLKSIYQHCQEVGLLILDDLGVEKSTEWAIEQLDMLVDYRYINGKKTVFTTNLGPTQLPARIKSRLKEGLAATLDGIDYREVKARVRS